VKTLKFSLIILIKFFPSVNGAGKTSSFKMLTGMKNFLVNYSGSDVHFLRSKTVVFVILLKIFFGKELSFYSMPKL
jgi:hypothetical protein